MKIIKKDDVFFLDGVLDEFSDFSPLKENTETTLNLNVSKVARINSIGVRNFVEFLFSWFPKPVQYLEVRPSFVETFNSIPQILGGENNSSEVLSVFVPFYCESCKKESEKLYSAAELKDLEKGGYVFPTQKCGVCSDSLDPDFSDDQYFDFLQNNSQ